MLKSFLLLLTMAGCGSAPEAMSLRFEAAPSCADLEITRTIAAVREHALVIEGCPDYADCDHVQTIELEGGPDLRTIAEPEKHRASLRMTAACTWELKVLTKETPAQMLFIAANDEESLKATDAPGWQIHNAGGKAWWAVRR